MTKNTLTVAAIQTSYGEDMAANIAKTGDFIREAAGRGAQVDPAFGTLSGSLLLHAAGPEMV